MRLRSVVGVCFLVALVGVIGSPEAVAAATCNTFDANNTPTSAFKGGDKIVVRGTGFAANSVVLVNLLQGNRTVELDRVRANDLGAFALTDATVPSSVSDGDAAIRALDARGSATCALTLTAGDGSEGSLGGLFWVWGLVLALFGGVLAMLTYRRWKAERLREAVDSLAWREQYDERSSASERVREPVTVGGRTVEAPHGRTDPSPSWTPDALSPVDAMRPADEVRPSWTTDGPRPSWARPDDARGFDVGVMHEPRDEVTPTWSSDLRSDTSDESPWVIASSSTDDRPRRSWEPAFDPARAARDDADDDGVSEPWQPGGGRDEPLADEPAYHPPPQRPIPERPVPARPGGDVVWSLDDDDDELSPIGAPRPFDDRFALDDDERPGRSVDDVRADDRDDDDPAPFRPPPFDEAAASRSDPARPVVARPVPQRSDPPARSEDDDEWDAGPTRARPRDGGSLGAETLAPTAPEPAEREPHEPAAAPDEPGATAVVPPPAAPAAPAVKPERDFAAALRDFLDKEDMELDRRSGVTDRPAALRPATLRPGGGLLEQDAGRIPQAPVEAASPATAQPTARSAMEPRVSRQGPVRPVAPRAPQPSVEPSDEPARPRVSDEAADDPLDSAWRPASDRTDEPSVKRGPEPSAPSFDASPWEAPEPTGRRVEPEPPVGAGAEPPPFDPGQRVPGPTRIERRSVERAADVRATDRPWAPHEPEAGVSEPPVLPVGWDDGRLTPSARTEDAPPSRTEPARTEDAPPRPSDAIARLRREVRNWKR